MRTRLSIAFLAFVQMASALDDLTVYTDDSLASGWENWSWNTEVDFAASDVVGGPSGTSISAKSDAWAALSLKLSQGTFAAYAGLRFDIAGNQPELQILFQSTADDTSSPGVPLSEISKTIVDTAFTSALIDFAALPGSGSPLGNGTWDRITFQALGNGASYHLDNVVLVPEIVISPEILSAEPITNRVVAVTTKGEVDLNALQISLGGKAVKVSSITNYSPPDTPAKKIAYVTLASAFAPGTLEITIGEVKFTHTLPQAKKGNVNMFERTAINPLIYGVNFPKSAQYIKTLGVTVSRWGGNAVTAYNGLDGHFTNAGNDWFFENRVANEGSADDWMGWVKGAGSESLLTVPALDWVAKDATSYSYPKSIYPEQSRFDPYNPDAGSGQFPNGTAVTPPPDPSKVYTPWNTTLAKKWLSGLKNKPKFAAIDNEIEIAHSTHQDMHPEPVDYDEELKRVIDFAVATKEALPSVAVMAPSTCSWWFYWTSAVGWPDTEAHGNVDFLPWFLSQMKQAERTYKKRLLDYLDIHYYFQPDTSKNDDAAKALRLRMTRSLWDPTYVDESWVGQDPQNHQADPGTVKLIPRIKKLIADNYPGTKLSISEWSSTNDGDVTGGLVTADALGLFGKYGLDAATYWATPDEMGPVGLAYWLFRGTGTVFGNWGVPVSVNEFDPDTQGIYAATNNAGKLSIVIINKSPSAPQAFDLSGVPTGKYFLRHFGGAAGVAKWQANITLGSSHYIVVPPYTAAFIQQQ